MCGRKSLLMRFMFLLIFFAMHGWVNAQNKTEEQNMAAINRLRNEISNTMMKVNLQKADFLRKFVQD